MQTARAERTSRLRRSSSRSSSEKSDPSSPSKLGVRDAGVRLLAKGTRAIRIRPSILTSIQHHVGLRRGRPGGRAPGHPTRISDDVTPNGTAWLIIWAMTQPQVTIFALALLGVAAAAQAADVTGVVHDST